jgi:hypothetical protein
VAADVDLANMMLLALRSSPERVYDRALRQFTTADIGEAFAAARASRCPPNSDARREKGLDMHAEFIRLLPRRPGLSRSTLEPAPNRPVGVVVLAVLVVSKNAPRSRSSTTSTTSLEIANLGCRQWEPLWLEAQAVPSATLVPCVDPCHPAGNSPEPT